MNQDNPTPKLTHTRLLECLVYSPDTGEFCWRISLSSKAPAGSIAGGIESGYRRLSIDGRAYMAHRLAWLYMTGEWPERDVDHKNRNRSDNRWENLRAATRTQNNANSKTPRTNKSGLKGAAHYPGGFTSQIVVGGKKFHLGCFKTAEEAHAAYCAAAQEHHGEFARVA